MTSRRLVGAPVFITPFLAVLSEDLPQGSAVEALRVAGLTSRVNAGAALELRSMTGAQRFIVDEDREPGADCISVRGGFTASTAFSRGTPIVLP